jgi:hypothetical protein
MRAAQALPNGMPVRIVDRVPASTCPTGTPAMAAAITTRPNTDNPIPVIPVAIRMARRGSASRTPAAHSAKKDTPNAAAKSR